MATFNKFNQFVEDLANGVHNLGADTLRIYLSNATPSASLDAVKTDLAEITSAGTYASKAVTIDSSTESGGTYTLACTTDETWTATGAAFDQFRYVVLYNDTPTSPADPLIGWWDYGSAVDVANGETFTFDVTASLLTIA